MRKTLAAGLAALTFGGAVAASAVPTAASAHDWHGYGGYYGGYHGYYGGYHHHHDNAAGAALVAGIAGLAIGAALADGGHHTYYRTYYAPAPYYDGYYDYGYYRPYAMCESRRWVWDPYIGRHVMVTSHYAC